MDAVFKFKDGTQVTNDVGGHDKGIILKIPNPHSSGYMLIVCAGLGEWGTSGSAWYLAKHWRDLSSRFGFGPFLIVLDVENGADQTARENSHFEVSRIPWWKRIRPDLLLRGK